MLLTKVQNPLYVLSGYVETPLYMLSTKVQTPLHLLSYLAENFNNVTVGMNGHSGMTVTHYPALSS